MCTLEQGSTASRETCKGPEEQHLSHSRQRELERSDEAGERLELRLGRKASRLTHRSLVLNVLGSPIRCVLKITAIVRVWVGALHRWLLWGMDVRAPRMDTGRPVNMQT